MIEDKWSSNGSNGKRVAGWGIEVGISRSDGNCGPSCPNPDWGRFLVGFDRSRKSITFSSNHAKSHSSSFFSPFLAPANTDREASRTAMASSGASTPPYPSAARIADSPCYPQYTASLKCNPLLLILLLLHLNRCYP